MRDRERNRVNAIKRVDTFGDNRLTDFPAAPAGTPSDVKARALFTAIKARVGRINTI